MHTCYHQQRTHASKISAMNLKSFNWIFPAPPFIRLNILRQLTHSELYSPSGL